MAGCQCGFGASCVGGNCTCPDGLITHANNKDCKNETCAVSDCLTCSSANICIRCVKFISTADGSCVDQCNGYAEISRDGSFQGTICRPKTDESIDNKLIIGIVAGVGVGLLLCVLAIIIACIYIRRTRKNVHLQNQQYKSPGLAKGSIRQYPAYDNEAYEEDMNRGVKNGVIDPAIYALQLEQLRPHKETLMALLGEIRPKLRAMDPGDPRVPTYKGVVHQLCRVLVLLHRDDTGASIPSDALGLIEWAHQMLEDHRQQQELHCDAVSPDVLGDIGHSRISYIGVEMETERLHSPLYAEPKANLSFDPQPPNDAGGAVNYYSSVPVPVSPQDATFPRTFATIHRTPSVPGNANNNGGKHGYARPVIFTRQMSESRKSENNMASAPMGYFANGRYYDPNPMPQTEVYAPTSSYSDRSTAPLSTFMPDRPRSTSLTSSCPTSEGEAMEGEEGSEGDVEMFPFDPKDATDPVQV